MVEANPVYNWVQQQSWSMTVETAERKPGIGEKVLARLSSKTSSEVPIEIKKMDSSGNISFNVAMKDLLTTDERKELRGTIPMSRRFGTFFVDSIGELLVRRNLDDFLTFLVKIKMSDIERLARMQHATFGLMEKGNRGLHFIFHVSLLHRIFVDMVGVLTEHAEDEFEEGVDE